MTERNHCRHSVADRYTGRNLLRKPKSSALIAYRLELLEKKVDKHNSVVERTFKLEEQAAVFEEKIKVANHRIEDLENR